MANKLYDELLTILKVRFDKNMNRHLHLKWADVQNKLEASPAKLKSLLDMENTGGEPDVIGFDQNTSEYIFVDCAIETPTGRRSLCYDDAALFARKEHKPAGSALAMAEAMGIEILSEEEYRALQLLGEFDAKTSSWIKTPVEIRMLDGALFMDRRYDHVFVYHNGAQSYYAVRGFRGSLRV